MTILTKALSSIGLMRVSEHEAATRELKAAAARDIEPLTREIEAYKEGAGVLHKEIERLNDRLNSVFGVDNWKAQGYKTREEEINDMAEVGRSLMERVASVTETGAEMSGWHPMDDPAEIVTDMANTIYEQRVEIETLRPDAQKWRNSLKRSRDRKAAKKTPPARDKRAKNRGGGK